MFTERSPRWVDLSTNEFKSAPPVYDREKIETFSESKSIIGIIRARLLDEERPIAIAPANGFPRRITDQNPHFQKNPCTEVIGLSQNV